DPDLIAARVDEAAALIGRDRLALSTRCGFASTEDGHALTEEQQWAKLREVVALSERVWGGDA
ncbi:MAG: 5-methyltetrahydropteroyltriglutamate--homocysteine S-methyltransferase, partial [Microbacteriaceae bacterium]|nr:5-methyltetrahydropteroyltriglutamate--homocysteine S-methyltransferase [Microbacteriaceae bacterium]